MQCHWISFGSIQMCQHNFLGRIFWFVKSLSFLSFTATTDACASGLCLFTAENCHRFCFYRHNTFMGTRGANWNVFYRTIFHIGPLLLSRRPICAVARIVAGFTLSNTIIFSINPSQLWFTLPPLLKILAIYGGSSLVHTTIFF